MGVDVDTVQAIFEEKTVLDYIWMVLRHWKLVVLVFLAGLGNGILIRLSR